MNIQRAVDAIKTKQSTIKHGICCKWRIFTTLIPITVECNDNRIIWDIFTVTPHGCHNVSDHRQLDCLFCKVFTLTYQSCTFLPFALGINRWAVDSPHKGPVMWKALPCYDGIKIKRKKTTVVWIANTCKWPTCVLFILGNSNGMLQW